MTKQQLLDKLQSSEELVKMAYLPLWEVISWVKELEDSNDEMNEDLIKELAEAIAEEITSAGLDVIGDYELSMRYREVELDDITFDERSLKETIRTAIKSKFE
jgi:hypothetical protein